MESNNEVVAEPNLPDIDYVTNILQSEATSTSVIGIPIIGVNIVGSSVVAVPEEPLSRHLF